MKALKDQPMTTINKLASALKRNRKSATTPKEQLEVSTKYHQFPTRIALGFQDGYTFVSPQDIIYCESDSNYTKFHLQDGNVLIAPKTLKNVEKMLEGLQFFRIHKQYLINFNHIKKYVKGDGSYVVMSNQDSLTIARNRKDDFSKLFIKF